MRRRAVVPSAAAWLTALGMVLSPGVAGALNILSLEPSAQNLRVGDVAVFELKMNFDDVTLGGDLNVVFDSAILSMSAVTFDENFPDDIDFRCPTDPAAPFPVPCILSSRGITVVFNARSVKDRQTREAIPVASEEGICLA